MIRATFRRGWMTLVVGKAILFETSNLRRDGGESPR